MPPILLQQDSIKVTERSYPDDNCKKKAKEVENIILSGPQCTPGPEQNFRSKDY